MCFAPGPGPAAAALLALGFRTAVFGPFDVIVPAMTASNLHGAYDNINIYQKDLAGTDHLGIALRPEPLEGKFLSRCSSLPDS